MSVLVNGQNGRSLMPTTTRKARILLKENKASVVCRHPFTIHLWYKTGCATQESSPAACGKKRFPLWSLFYFVDI